MGRHSRSDLHNAGSPEPAPGPAAARDERRSAAGEPTWEHWWEKTGAQPPILEPIAADPVRPGYPAARRPPAPPPDPAGSPSRGEPTPPGGGAARRPDAGFRPGPPGENGSGRPPGEPPPGGPPPGTDSRRPAYPRGRPDAGPGQPPRGAADDSYRGVLASGSAMLAHPGLVPLTGSGPVAGWPLSATGSQPGLPPLTGSGPVAGLPLSATGSQPGLPPLSGSGPVAGLPLSATGSQPGLPPLSGRRSRPGLLPPAGGAPSHPGLPPLSPPGSGSMPNLSGAYPVPPVDAESDAAMTAGRPLRAVSPGRPTSRAAATPWAVRPPAAGAAAAAAMALPAPDHTGPAPYETRAEPAGYGEPVEQPRRRGRGRGRVDTAAAEPTGRRSTVRAVPDPDEPAPRRGHRAGPGDLPPRDDDTPAPGGRRADQAGARALRAVDSEPPDHRDSTDTGVHYGFEDEPALVLQWGFFVLQTIFGAAGGLGAWLGFHVLWDRWPFYAAAAVGVAVTLMLVVARALRRRYGHELDLLTALVVVGVGVVVTVLPAAFVLQNR